MPALLLIFGGMTILTYIYIWLAPLDRGPEPWVRWQFVGDVAQLFIWFGIVGVLGWRRPVGLVRGSFSWLGALPLIAWSIASYAAVDLAGEAWVGGRMQLVAVLSIFVGAFTEEIVFRGFLYHGLTRRLGGSSGVVMVSVLFAAFHIPRLVREEVSGNDLVYTMIYYFVISMFLCRVRAQSGSIWFPTAIHTLWNLTLSGLWIWAIPDETFPRSFGVVLLSMQLVGAWIAYGLLVRSMYAVNARHYVAGPPDDKGRLGRGAKAVDWRALYGAFLRPPTGADLDRFTERALRSIRLAREEARAEGAKALGTEHLLLGLLHEADGVAAAALREWGIEPGDPERLEELQVEGEADGPALRWDLHVKRAIRLATLEADAWRDPRVGTEHLLVGLMALRRGEFASILRRRRVSPVWLRRTTLRLMAERTWSGWTSTENAAFESPAPA